VFLATGVSISETLLSAGGGGVSLTSFSVFFSGDSDFFEIFFFLFPGLLVGEVPGLESDRFLLFFDVTAVDDSEVAGGVFFRVAVPPTVAIATWSSLLIHPDACVSSSDQ
jgi:hypothetical protein